MSNPREKEYIYCPTCRSELIRKNIDRRNLLACPDCKFIFWNNPRPVTSVILEEDNKFLLIKRNKEPLKNYWVLPGGYIDYEETPEHAAVREVKEETNIDIEIINLVGVYQIDNDPQGINIDIIYSGKKKKGELFINEESNECNFFSADNLPELIAYKHREAIADYIKINNFKINN